MKKEAIFTINGKYCANPEPHILGSLPCCKGLAVDNSRVEPKDIIEYDDNEYLNITPSIRESV